MNGCSSVDNSISGIIRNNRVFTNLADPGVGINAADAGNLLVEGNFTFSAQVGFYGDTDSYDEIVVSHNSFINCYYGVYLANSGRRNISLLFNNISMTNDASAASVAFAFGTANYTNVVIRGNTAKFHAAPGPNGYSVYVGANSGMNGLTIAQNFFDGSFMWNLSDATNVNIHDNYDLRGVLLTNVNQTQPANGLTRRTVNANDSLNYADRYLGVLVSSAALTITLPSASGRAGKEFIVADESGNVTAVKSITIAPTSPDKVNGSTAGVAITSAYGTKTIISDGANWFAR